MVATKTVFVHRRGAARDDGGMGEVGQMKRRSPIVLSPTRGTLHSWNEKTITIWKNIKSFCICKDLPGTPSLYLLVIAAMLLLPQPLPTATATIVRRPQVHTRKTTVGIYYSCTSPEFVRPPELVRLSKSR